MHPTGDVGDSDYSDESSDSGKSADSGETGDSSENGNSELLIVVNQMIQGKI